MNFSSPNGCYSSLLNLVYGLILLTGFYCYIEMAIIVHENSILWFDRPLLELFQTYRTPGFDTFFLIITWLGSRFFLLPLGLVILTLLLRHDYRVEALFLALAFGGTILITIVTKLLVARERPDLFPSVIPLPISFSFPSAHASQITAFSLTLFFIIRRLWSCWQELYAVTLSVLTLLVTISRIYLQVHYPSDVLGGLLLGCLWVLGVYGLFVRFMISGGWEQDPPATG